MDRMKMRFDTFELIIVISFALSTLGALLRHHWSTLFDDGAIMLLMLRIGRLQKRLHG